MLSSPSLGGDDRRAEVRDEHVETALERLLACADERSQRIFALRVARQDDGPALPT